MVSETARLGNITTIKKKVLNLNICRLAGDRLSESISKVMVEHFFGKAPVSFVSTAEKKPKSLNEVLE